MSVQTEIQRIKNAKAELRTTLQEITEQEIEEALQLGHYSDIVRSLNIGNETLTKLIQRSTDITILNDTNLGENIGEIGAYGCACFDNLVQVDLSSVALVQRYAISYCQKLTYINLPVLLRANGSYNFSSCPVLTEVNVPNLQNVTLGMFSNDTALKFVDLPSVTRIANNAFAKTDLTELIVGQQRGTTVCQLENSGAFTNTPIADGLGTIYVPDNLINTYKTATNWSTFANIIKGISERKE